MEYNKARGGKWTDTKVLKDGMRAKIMDECVRSESQFKDKDNNPKIENIAKVQFGWPIGLPLWDTGLVPAPRGGLGPRLEGGAAGDAVEPTS